MKLYVYDHCPYCVRARMIFGLKNVPVKTLHLLNDDEATPISLVGKKMVPILQKADGTAMGESLDIVRYIDNLDGKPSLSETVRPEIEALLQKLGTYTNRLTMPRCISIGLEEFATPAAVQYFVSKKTAFIGDFAENLADTPALLDKINADLADAADLMRPFDKADDAGLEDILLFPVLRGLTMVKGIAWPETVRRYTDHMACLSAVPLFDDRAV